jgi:hypothetical protein
LRILRQFRHCLQTRKGAYALSDESCYEEQQAKETSTQEDKKQEENTGVGGDESLENTVLEKTPN